MDCPVKIIAPAGWNVDTILDYLRDNCPDLEMDNDGQLVLYTGLTETPEAELAELEGIDE